MKSRPGANDDSPELHEVVNMVIDDPEEQTLTVRLKDEDGLIQKARNLFRAHNLCFLKISAEVDSPDMLSPLNVRQG